MKAYKVVHSFADLLDDAYVYHVGDEFPRRGVIVKPERYEELAGTNNKLGRVLIEQVEIPAEKAQKARKTALKPSDEEIPAEKEKPVKKASTTKKSKK